MFYILNALRKWDEERQAKQPETVTELVLQQPPQKKSRTAVMIRGILLVNLMIIALLVVYLRKAGEAPVQTQAWRMPVAEKAVEKPLRAAVKAEEDKDNLYQKKDKANINGAKPAQEATASEAAKIASAAPKQLSIQELAAAKQAAAEKSVKKAEEENKKASDSSLKDGNKKVSSGEAVRQQEEPKQDKQARRAQRAQAAGGHPDGFGFVVPEEGGDDLYLSPKEMHRVLHGDKVLVRVSGFDRRGRREAKIIEVLEHVNQFIVGRYYLEGGVGFLIAENRRINQDVLVPVGNAGDARSGQVVTRWRSSPSPARTTRRSAASARFSAVSPAPAWKSRSR